MAGGNDHLEMVNNVGGERRPSRKRTFTFLKTSTGLLQKSALGFGPQSSRTPGLINIISSKTHLVFFYLQWSISHGPLLKSLIGFKSAMD